MATFVAPLTPATIVAVRGSTSGVQGRLTKARICITVGVAIIALGPGGYMRVTTAPRDSDRHSSLRWKRSLAMARTAVFDAHPERYERWFEDHRAAYVSELLALRMFVPWEGDGLEIGVGTGRFAAPLGVSVGLDPSDAMLARAAARAVRTVNGVAEALPFSDGSFDHALIVTTICFVDSPERMIAEAHRVLRPDGKLVIGFVDRESGLGQAYLASRAESLFYRDAVFHSAAEVAKLCESAGFVPRAWGQTLFRPLVEIVEIEPVRRGSGRGAFVVVAADRSDAAVARSHRARRKREADPARDNLEDGPASTRG